MAGWPGQHAPEGSAKSAREEAGGERREREGGPRGQERGRQRDVDEEDGAERVRRAARGGEQGADGDEIERDAERHLAGRCARRGGAGASPR